MEHLFNVEVAKKYGVNAAILIRHFQFWIIKNKTNKKHLHEGRTWTYCSVKAFTKIFPYWSARQVRVILDNLIKEGVITKGTYSPKKYDKTTWYAFVEEEAFVNSDKCICQIGQKDLSKPANGFVKNDQLIPDVITDKSTDEKTDKFINNFTSTPLSLQTQDEQQGCRLLVKFGVSPSIADNIVFNQNTPLNSIKQTIKNGLAKAVYTNNFVLEAGYIVQTLNKARGESKIVKPTKSFRRMDRKFAEPQIKRTPLSPEQFERKKQKMRAALGMA